MSILDQIHSGVDDRKARESALTPFGVSPVVIVGALEQTLAVISNSQQSELAAIKPLAQTDSGTFAARMQALRDKTRQSAADAINKAYDGLENAARQHPEEKPAIQQALQRVQQVVQSFTSDAGQALDAVDHAGALVIDGVSEGATRVADGIKDVATTVGGGVTDVANEVGDGFKSVFHF